jgi:hypothetical protein
MEYFAGLDVSMAQTHLCVMNRDGAVMHEVKVHRPLPISRRHSHKSRLAGGLCSRPAGWRRCSTRPEQAWIACRLHREPAGLSGAEVAGDAQDRPQRCARLGASCPHRLLQARPCEVAVGTRRSVVDHRSQEAGRPAGHPGEPNPRACRGIRCATAACVNRRIHPVTDIQLGE